MLSPNYPLLEAQEALLKLGRKLPSFLCSAEPVWLVKR
jgi:hypothetical protein